MSTDTELSNAGNTAIAQIRGDSSGKICPRCNRVMGIEHACFTFPPTRSIEDIDKELTAKIGESMNRCYNRGFKRCLEMSKARVAEGYSAQEVIEFLEAMKEFLK